MTKYSEIPRKTIERFRVVPKTFNSSLIKVKIFIGLYIHILYKGIFEQSVDYNGNKKKSAENTISFEKPLKALLQTQL